jgi:hypothetical protein
VRYVIDVDRQTRRLEEKARRIAEKNQLIESGV